MEAVTALVPDGLEPLGIWDTRVGSAWKCCMPEAGEWAEQHIRDAGSTYRAEFYLFDVPFAVLYRYARDEDGRIACDPETCALVKADPVVQVLDELPPARLLAP